MVRRLCLPTALLRAPLSLAFAVTASPTASPAQLAVRGATVHTMAGAAIADGVVLIEDGRITAVGPAGTVTIPEGYRTLTADVVTPGLVDAHTSVGLAGIHNAPHDRDELDKTGPFQPELRAFDAYNPREPLVEYLRQLGVTTVHTGPAPLATSGGQTMIARTVGDTVEQAARRPVAMVSFTLGPQVGAQFDSPGTRAKGVALLRTEMVRAQEYGRKRGGKDADKRPDRDLRLEAVAQVLAGELPALVTAHRATEIEAALRLAREMGFRLVLDGAAEAYLLLDAIREAGVPVILHPTMVRPGGETRNAAFDTAARLHAAGIPFAISGGYEGYVPRARVVLFEAAVAAANGLPFDAALAAITRDAAKILGVDDRVGSLEPGKDADLVLFDGDPFEFTTHVTGVVIDGKVVSTEVR